MALRQVRKKGDELLRKKARPVGEVTDRIKLLLQDMEETMHKEGGFIQLRFIFLNPVDIFFPGLIRLRDAPVLRHVFSIRIRGRQRQLRGERQWIHLGVKQLQL